MRSQSFLGVSMKTYIIIKGWIETYFEAYLVKCLANSQTWTGVKEGKHESVQDEAILEPALLNSGLKQKGES